uniref:Uncharacterized protein n=1 Tax=Anguilla anguilla TaxID=7936 RepID=A0A0E9TQ81_ANGAN
MCGSFVRHIPTFFTDCISLNYKNG